MNFFKSFGIYTISGIVSKAISFLLLPFFTHYLSQADYGRLTIFSNSIYFIAPLMNLGISETLTVEYDRLKDGNIKMFITNSLLCSSSVLAFAVVTVVLFHDFFSQFTGLSYSLLILICFLSFFNFFSDYLFCIFRNENKAISYAVFGFSKTLLELILAIYFIRFDHQGFMGRISSISITSSVCFIFVVAYFFKKRLLKLSFSSEWLQLIIKRGLPTIPLFFMVFVLNNADKYMINYFNGASKTGLYSLSSQFAMLLTVFTSSFIIPYYPFLYSNLNSGNYKKVVDITVVYILANFAILLILLISIPIFFDLFIENKFQGAIDYLLPVLAGQFFFSIYLILAGIIFYKRINHLYYYVAPVVIILSLTFNYIILAVYRVHQLAYTTLFANFICLLIITILCSKQVKQSFKYFFKSPFSSLTRVTSPT